MKQQDVRMLGLLLMPYGVVALSALASAGGSDGWLTGDPPPAAAHHRHEVQQCLQPRREPSEPARQARVEGDRQDPQSRSQSPGWMRHDRAEQEVCLRHALRAL